MSGYSDLLLVSDYAASSMTVHSDWSISFTPLAGNQLCFSCTLLSPEFEVLVVLNMSTNTMTTNQSISNTAVYYDSDDAS